MQLIVDASTLVAEALRARGRSLLRHPDLDLLAAGEASNETRYELRPRVSLLVERQALDALDAAKLLAEAEETLDAAVTVIPGERYEHGLPEARWRIPRDPNDAPSVALALVLDCGISTNDHDFFGCGIAVWATEVLRHHLEASPST